MNDRHMNRDNGHDKVLDTKGEKWWKSSVSSYTHTDLSNHKNFYRLVFSNPIHFHRLVLTYKWIKFIGKYQYAKLECYNWAVQIHQSCLSNV